jgi:phosphatidylglycerophosphate synthase
MTTSILYDKVLSPFYDRLSFILWSPSLHPNVITLIGGTFAASATLAIRRGHFGCACIAYTLYHACDNMDGKHARRYGKTSRFGAFLDHFVDGTAGMWVGWHAMAPLLFGLTPESELWWVGLHAGGCTWLAPHVEHVFSGVLNLGTRLVSVDEMFLLVSVILGLGWLSDGAPLVTMTVDARLMIFSGFHALAIAYVGGCVLYHTLRRRTFPPWRDWWKYALVAAYVTFWQLGRTSQLTGSQIIGAWLPLMTFLVSI